METLTKQALVHAANLTLPSVIVIKANLECAYCRRRVTRIMSKVSGLKEYMVDVGNQRVIIRGDIRPFYHSFDDDDALNKNKKFANNLWCFFLGLLGSSTTTTTTKI